MILCRRFVFFVFMFILFGIPVALNAAQTDYKINKVDHFGGADILAACKNNPYSDITCRNILELNDFSIKFINELIRQYGLKKYEKWLGPMLGVLINEKLTTGVVLKSHKLDLTYNTNTKVLSFNIMRDF